MLYVGVIGPGSREEAGEQLLDAARAVGRELAGADVVVVCGGLGGVMEAVCEGVRAGKGCSLGLLPGHSRHEANRHVSLAVPTGLGEARNVLVVGASDVLIAIGKGLGTLSEIAFAVRAGKHVVGLDTWSLEDHGELVHRVASAAQAAALARDLGARADR